MLRFTVVAALVAAVAVSVSALQGGDFAGPVSQTKLTCVKNWGMEHVVVRAYRNYGAGDSNALSTLNNAAAAGIPRRDIYVFPCFGGKTARQTITDTLAAAPKGNWNTMWLDIEHNPSSSCTWSSSTTRNCQFVRDLISEAKAQGVTNLGLYSSQGDWGNLFPSGCSAGVDNNLPLWYARYLNSGAQGFDTYKAFGGWRTPYMHQYADHPPTSLTSKCGSFNTDMNFRP